MADRAEELVLSLGWAEVLFNTSGWMTKVPLDDHSSKHSASKIILTTDWKEIKKWFMYDAVSSAVYVHNILRE